MSDQKRKQDQSQSQQDEHKDKEGMAQGADAADPASLKKQIDFEGEKPNQQKQKS